MTLNHMKIFLFEDTPEEAAYFVNLYWVLSFCFKFIKSFCMFITNPIPENIYTYI